MLTKTIPCTSAIPGTLRYEGKIRIVRSASQPVGMYPRAFVTQVKTLSVLQSETLSYEEGY